MFPVNQKHVLELYIMIDAIHVSGSLKGRKRFFFSVYLFISRINFIISSVEYENFYNVWPGYLILWHKLHRVKLGNIGHQVNSDIHLQTVEIRLTRSFTVCLVNCLLYSNNQNMVQTWSVSEFTCCQKLPY